MAAESECVKALEGLRARIPVLLAQTDLSEEFTAWRGELLAAVQACFGNGSLELSEIRSIPFEAPKEAVEFLTNFFQKPSTVEPRKALDPRARAAMSPLDKSPEPLLTR